MPEKTTIERAREDAARENRRPPRPASSCGKKSITSGKGSTAPAPPSRPSPSGCPRRAGPE